MRLNLSCGDFSANAPDLIEKVWAFLFLRQHFN